MMYVLLLIGFLLLIKGADFFVEGSASVARLLKVPSVVIGLTIVALGTSAPETAVSVTAGLTGNNELAISNILGSNLFNLLVVVGVCAAIKAFPVDSDIMKRDFPFSIGVTVLLGAFLLNGVLQRWEGILFLTILFLYLYVMIRSAIRNRPSEPPLQTMRPLASVIYIIGGIAAIAIGGDMVVDNASKIASAFGLSQTMIGLTIVAMGTSLPELVTSIVAARKGESGLALGNVVGSNLLNILFILGVSSTLYPIRIMETALIDLCFLLAVSLFVYICCRRDKKVSRVEGIIFVTLYLCYTCYIVIR